MLREALPVRLRVDCEPKLIFVELVMLWQEGLELLEEEEADALVEGELELAQARLDANAESGLG